MDVLSTVNNNKPTLEHCYEIAGKGASGFMKAEHGVLYDSCLAKHSKTAASTQHIHLINYSSTPQEAHSCVFQMDLLKLYRCHNKMALRAGISVSFVILSVEVTSSV